MQSINNSMVMILIFFIGIFLIVESISISNKIPKNCNSDKLRKSNTAILSIGIIFIVSSMSFFICQSTCDCGGDQSGNKDINYLVGSSIVLSLVLVVLGSIISSESKLQNCGNINSGSIWGSGLIVIIVCSLYLGYKYYLLNRQQNTQTISFGM
jgi:hypothetical protein